MRDQAPLRSAAVALIGSGCASILFWIIAASAGTFAGAAVVQGSSWIPAQSLHVIAALLALFGFMGVYAAERHRTGSSGLVAFVLATMGNVAFLVDGVVALVIFPSLARSAPTTLDASGAMNQGATLALFIVIAAINLIGQVAFGVVTWRAGVFARSAAALLVIGGILFNLPPGPVPLVVLAVGGVLWGVGVLWLGWSLWTGVEDAITEPAAAHAPLAGG